MFQPAMISMTIMNGPLGRSSDMIHLLTLVLSLRPTIEVKRSFWGISLYPEQPGVTPAIETFGLGYYFFDPTTRDIGGRQPASNLEGRGISVTAIGKFAGLELTSITGYKYSKTDFFADSDPSTCGCVQPIIPKDPTQFPRTALIEGSWSS